MRGGAADRSPPAATPAVQGFAVKVAQRRCGSGVSRDETRELPRPPSRIGEGGQDILPLQAGYSPGTLSIDSPPAGRPVMVPTVIRMPRVHCEGRPGVERQPAEPNLMRILIVTSCTGQKTVGHPRGLTGDDFAQGSAHVQEREVALADCLTPARDLYRGQQHVRLMRGVKGVAGRLETHLQVVSAGYGLIRGERKIAPYECTFSGRGKADLRAWADRLGIPAAFRALMADPYDLCLWLLGDDYLAACGIDSRLRLASPTIALCGSTASRNLPPLAGLTTVVLGNPEARRFSCGLVALKGDIAARLLTRLAETPDLLPTLIHPDTDLLELLERAQTALKAHATKAQANLAACRCASAATTNSEGKQELRSPRPGFCKLAP